MGAHDLHPGAIVAGQYRIGRMLDSGGQGAVFEVEHLKTGRQRALKVLLAEFAATPDMLARFEREARIGASIDSEHIVEVFDTGVDEATRLPFLVMELLVGETLESRVQRVGAAPVPKVRWVMTELCHAMAAAHAAGVVHRDLKPANIFIARRSGIKPRSLIKVLDFGIAKALQEIQTKQQTKGALGTPGWLAPEQTSSDRVGPQTDVWAIGLIAYFVLTGRAFWKASLSSAGELPRFLRELIVDNIPSASQRLDEQGGDLAVLPPGFDGWFARCVAREPSARYTNAELCYAGFEELFGALPQFAVEPIELEPTSVQGPPSGGAGLTHSAGNAGTLVGGPPQSGETLLAASGIVPLAPRRSPPRGRHRTIAIVGGAIAVGGVACAATIIANRGGGDRSAASSVSSSSATASSSSAAPVAPRLHSAVAATRGKTWLAVHELPDDAAKTVHHARLTEEGGRVVKIERVDPTGQVQETRTIQYQSESVWEETRTSSTGVLIETVTIEGAIERHRARSGSPFVSGCAQLERTFSPSGDVVERKCQSAQGAAIIDADGCQSLRYEYDGSHQLTKERCFQDDGTASLDRYGVHEWRLKWNKEGRQDEWAGLDLEGHAVVDELDGCAKTAYGYDAAGNRVQETCIGASGLATQYSGRKAAKTIWSVDEHGCRTRESYLTADDRSTAFETDVFAISWSRDSKFARFEVSADVETLDCRVLSSESKKQDGSSTSRRKFALDTEGKTVEETCFEGGRPAACNKGGGSRLTYVYNSLGLRIRTNAFNDATVADFSNSYPHETRYEYDSRGLLSKTAYFDELGLPAAALGDTYSLVFTYDELGSQSSLATFGKDGPVLDRNILVHRVDWRFDDRHRIAQIFLLDDKGEEVKVNKIWLGDVKWPEAASRVELRRDGKQLFNDFFDWHGTRIETRDCATRPCHAFLND